VSVIAVTLNVEAEATQSAQGSQNARKVL